MAVNIDKDGTIHAVATTHLPLARRPRQTPIGTKTILSKDGITVRTTMPGVVARNRLAVTEIHFTAEDIVEIVKAKLENATPEDMDKVRQVLLGIGHEAAVGWVRYLLDKLA